MKIRRTDGALTEARHATGAEPRGRRKHVTPGARLQVLGDRRRVRRGDVGTARAARPTRGRHGGGDARRAVRAAAGRVPRGVRTDAAVRRFLVHVVRGRGDRRQEAQPGGAQAAGADQRPVTGQRALVREPPTGRVGRGQTRLDHRLHIRRQVTPKIGGERRARPAL